MEPPKDATGTRYDSTIDAHDSILVTFKDQQGCSSFLHQPLPPHISHPSALSYSSHRPSRSYLRLNFVPAPVPQTLRARGFFTEKRSVPGSTLTPGIRQPTRTISYPSVPPEYGLRLKLLPRVGHRVGRVAIWGIRISNALILRPRLDHTRGEVRRQVVAFGLFRQDLVHDRSEAQG